MGTEKTIRNDNITTGDEGTGGWGNRLQVWKDNFDKVKKVVDSMQPGKMHTSATAYSRLATRMDESVGLIYNQAIRLTESWGGEDAEKAMKQMDKAYQQAKEIHDKSDTTSKALAAHGQTMDGWQKQYGSGSAMDGRVKDAFNWGSRLLAVNPVSAPAAIGNLIGNNMGAEQAMNSINDGTKQSNGNFPAGIRQDMPDVRLGGANPIKNPGGPGHAPGSPKMPGAGGSPGGAPGDMPGGPGDIPDGGPGHLPGGGPSDLPDGGPGGIPGGGPGGIPEGPGTDLASLPGGGGPGGGPGLGGGVPGGGAGGGHGLGGGGLGGGPGALGGADAGGMFGAPGGLAGKVGMGKGGTSGMGMPMGAGARGGGADGDEHERSTWLTEDEDVWGGNDDTTPPVIG